MNKTWILVAHRGGARLFEAKGSGGGLMLLQDIPHPEGKLKDKDLGSDEPGRGFDSHGARHAFQQEQGPAARIAEQFAKHLAALLDDGRVGHRFQRLVLVAEPHLLGLIRAALPQETAAMVDKTINKDLGHVSVHELPGHLEGAVPA
jgi:protein required for attachment to host cells